MNKRQIVFLLATLLLSVFVSTLVTSRIVTAGSGGSKQKGEAIPGAAQKWEYQIIFGGPKNGSQAISELNRLGEQGYEVAGYSTSSDADGKQNFSVLLRRCKP